MALKTHQAALMQQRDEYRVLERQLLMQKCELSKLSNTRKELLNILTAKGIPTDKFDLEPGDPQQSLQPVSNHIVLFFQLHLAVWYSVFQLHIFFNACIIHLKDTIVVSLQVLFLTCLVPYLVDKLRLEGSIFLFKI